MRKRLICLTIFVCQLALWPGQSCYGKGAGDSQDSVQLSEGNRVVSVIVGLDSGIGRQFGSFPFDELLMH